MKFEFKNKNETISVPDFIEVIKAAGDEIFV